MSKKSFGCDVAYIYLRLSVEDEKRSELGESGSITNQRKILRQYCHDHGIVIAREFVDDDYSGGNFNRPSFQEMLRSLKADRNVTMVLTKDLSRLGRDMAESSSFAERYFPEHGIHYIAVADNFDSEKDNDLAPFQFAMNDVYLRDSSKKVKGALHTMMDNGEYCFRAPYGYRKDPEDNHKLIPDEDTAPVVKKIFRMAADGYSTWAIAEQLTKDGVYPPLKHRVYCIEGVRSGNAEMMSDDWNNTTVKRILKNPVYLGHTYLGKSKKVSPKSDKKRFLPETEWRKTDNTHEPLVSQETFDLASRFLGKRRKEAEKNDRVRVSVFNGLVFCETCGSAMCSSGTVYNGEREKYWYLTCQRIPKRSKQQCESGARIKYSILYDIVLKDLNQLICLSDEEKEEIIEEAMELSGDAASKSAREKKIRDSEQRIVAIDGLVMKIYEDLYSEKIDEDRARRMIDRFQKESDELSETIESLRESEKHNESTRKSYEKFFALTQNFTEIKALTPEILYTFIDKIVVGPKIYPEGVIAYARSKIPYRQTIRIYYKFIGDQLAEMAARCG